MGALLFASKITFTDLDLAIKHGFAFFLQFTGNDHPSWIKKRVIFLWITPHEINFFEFSWPQ